jgi:hypothetical protein
MRSRATSATERRRNQLIFRNQMAWINYHSVSLSQRQVRPCRSRATPSIHRAVRPIGMPRLASVMRRATAIHVIHPYRCNGMWVFDDPEVGLVREPFVAGMPEIIDYLVRDIPDAHLGFNMLWSTGRFLGPIRSSNASTSRCKLHREREGRKAIEAKVARRR